jgi:hypothetical protein
MAEVHLPISGMFTAEILSFEVEALDLAGQVREK